MFQWTSITEWLHPAVPPVKTLPFFRKYFHSTIIASICSYTVATLAMSLRLSEFTAERVANVYARVWTFQRVCGEGLDACTRRLAYSAFISREETDIGECVELEQQRNVMKQDISAATAPHTPTYLLLLLFDGWFNRVDFSWWAVCAKTIWLVHPNSQKACKQQNKTRERSALFAAGKLVRLVFLRLLQGPIKMIWIKKIFFTLELRNKEAN